MEGGSAANGGAGNGGVGAIEGDDEGIGSKWGKGSTGYATRGEAIPGAYEAEGRPSIFDQATSQSDGGRGAVAWNWSGVAGEVAGKGGAEVFAEAVAAGGMDGAGMGFAGDGCAVSAGR